MALIFTQTFNETFSGVNANPIDPAKWATSPGLGALQQLNHNLLSTTVLSGANYIGAVVPSNQYVDVTFSAFTGSTVNLWQIGLRGNANQQNEYVLSLQNNGDGTLDTYIAVYVNNAENKLLDIGDVPFLPGDIFRFCAFGTLFQGFRNGALLGSASDSNFSSGTPGNFIQLGGIGEISNLAVSNYAGGIVSGNFSSAPTLGVIYPGAYPGLNLRAAFTNPQQLDLLQVVDQGAGVIWSLNAQGNAAFNPNAPTSSAVLGRFEGQTFAAAFPNPGKFDILQVVNSGGSVVFHVDYQGNASTP